MLVLIAGITGNLGQKLASSLLSRGHQVRGLGRSPSKLPPALGPLLESFVESTSYYDVPALDTACTGVDAVICAYLGTPELLLDGQLLLLRAAERAGATKYVAASWSHDWRHMALRQQDSYDNNITFANHAELTSSLKPIHVFTGALGEVLFSAPGRVDFRPSNNGAWDSAARVAAIWGDEHKPWRWTSEADAAEFTAAIVSLPPDHALAHKQFWNVASGVDSLAEIARVYAEVRGGAAVELRRMGSVEELRAKALAARAQGSRNRWWEYIMWFYILYAVDGTWDVEVENDLVPGVEATGLRRFLEGNPEL